LTISLQAKAQSTIVPKDSVLKQPTPTIIRGVDISKMSPNEQGLVMYMETLSDVEAFELLKTLVSGEIVYKKKNEP
ncbi:MAG: hypothetical protein ACKO5L_06685, partial [Bacteroidota bacterium]